MALDPHDYSTVVKVRSGKTYPDLYSHPATKIIQRETAREAGWPLYYDASPCHFGHVAARYVTNTLCTDCHRVKAGKEPVYPKAKDRAYRKLPEPKAPEAAGAPIVVAPPKPPEPSKKEQDFLAALAMTGDFDAAAASASTTRGQIEARASCDPTFKAALTDLCERQGIQWTRASDVKTFRWTPEIGAQLIRRYIDTGLIEVARTELGIAASDYQAHLQESPEFAAKIEEARPFASETLRERALAAAERGNDRLLKVIQEEESTDFVQLAGGQKIRRLGDVDQMRNDMAALLNELRRSLSARERLREVCVQRTAERKPTHQSIEVPE